MAAEVDKVLKLVRRFVATVDDVRHIGSENERCPVALEIAKHLSITEEFSVHYRGIF